MPWESSPPPPAQQKRYLCARYKSLLIYPCQFQGGVYTTSDEREQHLIETSASFVEGSIRVVEEVAQLEREV